MAERVDLADQLQVFVEVILRDRAEGVGEHGEPLDVALSCYIQNFQTLDFTWSMEDIAAYYLEYERLMDHWRKVLPVDIYLETGAYGWSGTLNQAPNLNISERMANLKADNKLFVNRDIFRQLSAAREAEIEEKLKKN